MLLGLAGCTTAPISPEATPPTETTAPAGPDAAELFHQAKEDILALADLVLRENLTEDRSFGGETFTTRTTQIIHCQGLGTETMCAKVQDTATYGSTLSKVESSAYYDDGTGYTCIDGAVFKASLTPEEFMDQYLPAVLLDETLYESITLEETSSGTVLTFTAPTAQEDWLPYDDVVLEETSGTAVLNSRGKLTETTYTTVCTTGGVTREITASVKLDRNKGALDLTGTLAEIQDLAVELPDLSIPAAILQAEGVIRQTDSVTSAISRTILTQAAQMVVTESYQYDYLGKNQDFLCHIETNRNFQDFSGNSQSSRSTEDYADGVYTFAVEGEEPEAGELDPQELRKTLVDTVISYLPPLDQIQSAEITDTGSNVLLSFVYRDKLGASYEKFLCSYLFQDENALTDKASDYKTKEISGYLSLDKFTGLPVAAGTAYGGSHTIDDAEYPLTMQVSQTYFLGSDTAYETITGEAPQEEAPDAPATPLFYKVTGADGQQMWLLGTIHVGDARTAYLPKEIYDAFDAADSLAVEFDTLSFAEHAETDPELQAMLVSAYLYTDGTTLVDHLDAKTLEALTPVLQATGNYDPSGTTLLMRPSILSSSIENYLLQQGYLLSGNKGVDHRLLLRARAQDKEILDVESAEFQIQMLTGYSDEVQEMLLQEALSYNVPEYCGGVQALYELWCRGDEAALREALAEDTSEMTPEELALYEEYNTAMMTDRNATMLEVAKDYLESGDVVFYAVGLAHLLAEDGLVNTLRAAGYTVELVPFP